MVGEQTGTVQSITIAWQPDESALPDRVRILKEDQLSLGGRVDLLYGTDFLYTVAAGLDSDWNSNRYWLGHATFMLKSVARH